MEENLKEKIIALAVQKIDDPFKNITVKEVAKDLKMGENLANEVFKRKDFPFLFPFSKKKSYRLAEPAAISPSSASESIPGFSKNGQYAPFY